MYIEPRKITAKEKKEYTAFLNKLDIEDFLDYITFIKFYNFHGGLQDMEQALDSNVFREELLNFISKKPIAYLDVALEYMQEKIALPFQTARVVDTYPVLVSHILFKKLNNANQQQHVKVKSNKI